MYKKVLFILAIYFFLFSLSKGSSAQSIPISGYDWKKWNASSKLSFVEGWVKCGNEAWGSLPFNFNKMDESNEFLNSTKEYFKDDGIVFPRVTIGQIIDTIDKIYSDPRVMTMDITEVMPFVSGRLIIGWTERELDEVIAITVRLKQCEKEKGHFADECGKLMKERNTYLQKLKKK